MIPNRHIPRVCHHCGAPMGGNEDDCWRCGTPWVAGQGEPPSAPDVHQYEAGSAAPDVAVPIA